MEASKIEWTDHTFNPWIGCTKVGPGCDNCYAEALMDKRHHRVTWGGDRSRTGPGTWAMPLKWQRQASAFYEAHHRRQRVFCSSLADVFDNQINPAWRADLAKLIIQTPGLDWLLLTKRIGNVPLMLLTMFGEYPGGVPRNVRVGATIVNQDEWDRDVSKIAQVAVIVGKDRVFLSMEPLLGAVTLTHPRYRFPGMVGWVIVGGESGPKARPVHPEWIISLRDECATAGVPFLFKQWGEWLPFATIGPAPVTRFINGKVDLGPDKLRCHDDGQWMAMVGKKNAGRLLHGITHDGFPV